MRRGPGRRRPNAADQAAEVARIKRRKTALELRIHDGLTYARVGELTGVSEAQAINDVRKAMAELPKEDAETRRARACRAIDTIVRVHTKRAREGDEKSARVVVQALALDSAISGYKAPEQVDLRASIGTTATPAQARAVMQELFGGHVQAPAADDPSGSGDPRDDTDASDSGGPAEGAAG